MLSELDLAFGADEQGFSNIKEIETVSMKMSEIKQNLQIKQGLCPRRVSVFACQEGLHLIYLF